MQHARAQHATLRRVLATLLLVAGLPADAAEPVELQVDFAATAGKFRPLHGVNGGPLNQGELVDLSKHWRELKIPLARLHDSEWPAGTIVDLHAVFPSLPANPGEAGSYQFAKTDEYLQPIAALGVPMLYRLGESIEHSARKHHVHPPADVERWSQACLGIVRHYNEGWADGFRHDIQYWEIWNEPENRPACWTGTDAQYLELYKTASKAIKREFPGLKIGGPAMGSVGQVADGRLEPSALLAGFSRMCRDSHAPLDFFSWHSYSDNPQVFVEQAKAIRAWLNDQGWNKTELHLNEWNFLPDHDWGPVTASGHGSARQRWYERSGGPEGAAFVAATLMMLQDSPVDMANFFAGDTGLMGLFDRFGNPRKTFYAVQAFRKLLETPRRVQAQMSSAAGLAAIAGLNEQQTAASILISNFGSSEQQVRIAWEHLPWPGETEYMAYRLDQQHDLATLASRFIERGTLKVMEDLPSSTVLLIQLRPRGVDAGPAPL